VKPFLLGIALCSLLPVANAAAIVTCSDGVGDTQTVYNGECFTGRGNDSLSYLGTSGVSIGKNSFDVTAFGFPNTTPITSPNSPPPNAALYPLRATVTWSDSFALPESDPNDIVAITVIGYVPGHPA
jgi:hypothetical protein